MTKVFFKTFGCTLNQSDTEIMQGVLLDAGFELVQAPEESEVIVVNTCAVKKPTEVKVHRYLRDIKKYKKRVVVVGCMAQAQSNTLEGYSLMGPHNLSRIVEVIEETMNGSTVSLLGESREARYNIPKVRKNPVIEILPICSGCTGECTYCIVRNARGDLYSYSRSEIIRQARKSLTDGVKELWLTAQDTGCYGADIGYDLPELISDLARIPEDFRIRVGMMNPNHALAILPRLIKNYKDERVFKFLHIPVQSGSDKILKHMKRRYSVRDFKRIVRRVRQQFPMISIATDIICGYPEETDEDFQSSLDLIEEMKPDIVNVSRFFSRPNTEAAGMTQLPGETLKKRSRIFSSAFEQISFDVNRKWLGWTGEILVDEKGKGNSFIGRNFAYKPVVVDGNFRLGQVVMCRIVNTTSHYLRGVA